MTVNKNLAEFVAALDQMIESAASCVRDHEAFFAANRDIEALIAERWPDLSSELADPGPTPEETALIQQLSSRMAGLETLARARLVWAEDFDEYMRTALASGAK